MKEKTPLEKAQERVVYIHAALTLNVDEGSEVYMRPHNSFFEFGNDFFKRLQNEMKTRLKFAEMEIEDLTAVETFVMKVLGESEVRSIGIPEGKPCPKEK